MKKLLFFILLAFPCLISARENDIVQARFCEAYMGEWTGKTQIEVPEAYELANIIWMLSPAGRQTHDIPRTGKYYEEVQKYFDPYVGHPIFQQLDMQDSLLIDAYYQFRDYSFAYHFEGNRLIGDPHYTDASTAGSNAFVNYFVRLKSQVEDFASVSKFRTFFADHYSYYQSLIEREKKALPLDKMGLWLDTQFPGQLAYQSYKVFFSPLIGAASMRSQCVYSNDDRQTFAEMLLFVCGPEVYDDRIDLSEQQRSGLLATAVFLEIDRNFTAPHNSLHSGEILKGMKWMDLWVSSKSSPWHKKPEAVFNEYLSYALVCLWAESDYPSDLAKFLVEEQQHLMIRKRGFKKFKQFVDLLRDLHKSNPEKTISALYPQLISWCSRQ